MHELGEPDALEALGEVLRLAGRTRVLPTWNAEAWMFAAELSAWRWQGSCR